MLRNLGLCNFILRVLTLQERLTHNVLYLIYRTYINICYFKFC